ncbi:MAG: phosphoglycerate mutase 1 family [Acidimicrobiales bacterium]|jgi:2,3-bisphosphoglycerate-dependent phosphoglycerate mutase|nr:phosphoglycerate mutase 1 family [Acidimicrobiales bacterium]
MTLPLVLLRHGESEWNRANRFTGWYDCDLSPAGEAEAQAAGKLLAAEGIAFDLLHTSLLIRAIRTADLALAEMGQGWLPVRRHWRLNERHYGRLQGLDKKKTRAKYGDEKLLAWRRSYDVAPPKVARSSPHHPINDPRYAALPPDVLPAAECLKDVVDRMLPYWHDVIVDDLRAGKRVLVAAHGNSLRALVKHLLGISDAKIPKLEIPTGVPWLFELDEADPCHVVSERQLGDPEDVKARAEAVARQAG